MASKDKKPKKNNERPDLVDSNLTSLFEDSAVNTNNAFSVPVNALSEDVAQPKREYYKPILESIRDMYARGVQENHPIQVIKDPYIQDRYIIIDGVKRWEVAMDMGIKHVFVEYSKYPTRIDFFINVPKGVNFTPMETANILKYIKSDGGSFSSKDIAQKVNLRQSAVSSYLKLLDLPDCIMRLYTSGDCRDVLTLKTLKSMHVSDPIVIERLLNASKGSFGRYELESMRKIIPRLKYSRASIPLRRRLALENLSEKELDYYLMAQEIIKEFVAPDRQKAANAELEKKVIGLSY